MDELPALVSEVWFGAGRERGEDRPETGRKEEERWKRRSLPPGKVQQGRYLHPLTSPFYCTEVHCKAGEANTSSKTASCEAGPGTMRIYVQFRNL